MSALIMKLTTKKHFVTFSAKSHNSHGFCKFKLIEEQSILIHTTCRPFPFIYTQQFCELYVTHKYEKLLRDWIKQTYLKCKVTTHEFSRKQSQDQKKNR